MDKLKVLNIVIAKVWGGGEQYVYDTAKEMAKRGVKVYIAVDKTNTSMQQRFAEVAEVVEFNLYPAVGLFALKDLVKFIKNRQVNIINCHSGHAMQLCLLLKMLTDAKLVMFKHNAIRAKHDFYHNWQRKHTDAFICVSKLVYDLQTQGLTNEAKQKFYLVYNGIDTEKFDKYKNIKKDDEKFIIGYAGRIADDKGIDILLKAFVILNKKYDNIYLQLAGNDDGYLKKVQQFIDDNKLQNRIEYLGCLRDMELFYKKLDIFVLPSIVKEAFGLTICEAMYCGVPVVTTDSGAQTEIIEKNINGLIVVSDNVEELYNAILRIYRNYDSFIKNSRLSKDKVLKNFTSEKCSKSLLKIYNSLL